MAFTFLNFWLMSHEKFNTSSCCAGGLQYSGTISIEGDVTKNSRNLLIGKCVKLKEKEINVC